MIDERLLAVYIVTNKRNGTLYTGVSSHLVRRVWEHRSGVVPGFAEKYGLTRLVWFEPFGDLGLARLRERRIESWRRAWKLELIEAGNPN